MSDSACYIIGAGPFYGLGQKPQIGDYILAADGGYRHCQTAALTPDLLLGDFDSLEDRPTTLDTQTFPVEKDDTDSMLAIKKGLELGCDTFYIYGALEGKRVDHTMANFQALQYLAERGVRGYLVGRRQIATAIHNDSLQIPPYFIDYLSVFCMGKDATGVNIRGAQYELENATLTSGFPLGVSNRFIQKKVTVSVEDGTLLLMWRRSNGTL